MDTSAEKSSLRREILAHLKGMGDEERTRASAILCAKLAADADFQRASLIASFAPLRSELDPTASTTKSMARLCYPRVASEGAIVFHEVPCPGELASGSFGVMEPVPGLHRVVRLEEIDVVLVPGLAFEPDSGGRLGRGGGYYDRFLAAETLRATKIGVCHSLQVRRDIPLLDHDIRVDRLIVAPGDL